LLIELLPVVLIFSLAFVFILIKIRNAKQIKCLNKKKKAGTLLLPAAQKQGKKGFYKSTRPLL